MEKDKKYAFRTFQHEDSWSAEIIRRVTSKKTRVSMSKTGFATASAASEWGEKELKRFLLKLEESNKRHAGQRKPEKQEKTA